MRGCSCKQGSAANVYRCLTFLNVLLTRLGDSVVTLTFILVVSFCLILYFLCR